jgi:hypothetical protein
MTGLAALDLYLLSLSLAALAPCRSLASAMRAPRGAQSLSSPFPSFPPPFFPPSLLSPLLLFFLAALAPCRTFLAVNSKKERSLRSHTETLLHYALFRMQFDQFVFVFDAVFCSLHLACCARVAPHIHCNLLRFTRAFLGHARNT